MIFFNIIEIVSVLIIIALFANFVRVFIRYANAREGQMHYNLRKDTYRKSGYNSPTHKGCESEGHVICPENIGDLKSKKDNPFEL